MAYQPYSRELNRQFLSGAIKYPHEVMAEVGNELTEKDFDSEANRVVFSSLQSCLASGGPYSELVLIDRMNSMGIKIGGALEPAVYIGSLLGLAVSAKAAIAIAKQIKKVSVRRELHEAARKVQLAIEEDATSGEPMKSSELVAKATGVFNEKVSVLSSGTDNTEPKDLYGTMDKFINAETSFERNSLPSPYVRYNDLFGNFDPSNIYTFVARLKTGKSAFSMSILQLMAQADKNDEMRALVLDTEMSTEEVQSRIISSISGVKEFYIRHKLYKKNKYMADKVDEAYEKMRPIWGKIDHVFVGNWDLAEQISTVKRWYYKSVKDKGKKGIFSLDYTKLGSTADFSSKTSRDLLLGFKIDQWKNLTKELEIPMINFCQANREGEDSKQGAKMQNTTVVAGSDLIAAFSSNVYLLEKLTPEQRALLHQTEAGTATHSLRIIAPRQLGPNEMGLDKLVKYKDERGKDRWCEDYILFSFENFLFREVSMFSEAYERSQTVVNVQKKDIDTSGVGLL